MAIQTKDTLKSYFETGKKPTQEQFASLIDSLLHVSELLNLNLVKANSTEAVAGNANDRYMTPVRTKEAIVALTRLADIPDLATEVQGRIDTAINVLKDGVGGAYDTLKEIAEYIANDETVAAALTQRIGDLESGKEPAFEKKTAFNKDFGRGAGEVAEGNHTPKVFYTDFGTPSSDPRITDNGSIVTVDGVRLQDGDIISNNYTSRFHIVGDKGLSKILLEEDISSIKDTNIGHTGNLSYIDATNLPLSYFVNLPLGWSRMVKTSGNAVFPSLNDSYGYLHRVANRDSDGGYAFMLYGYNSNQVYYGYNTRGSANPYWHLLSVDTGDAKVVARGQINSSGVPVSGRSVGDWSISRAVYGYKITHPYGVNISVSAIIIGTNKIISVNDIQNSYFYLGIITTSGEGTTSGFYFDITK